MLEDIKNTLSTKADQSNVEGWAALTLMNLIEDYQQGNMNKLEFYTRIKKLAQFHTGASRSETHHYNVLKHCNAILNNL